MFSTTFRYALISLIELSRSQGLRQASAIASEFNLSQHYLSVVLRELRKLGLVDSQKGKNGGYWLTCNPEQVNLLLLYRSLAGSSQDESAASNHRLQARSADVWLRQVAERWSQELASTTLADLQSLEAAGSR
ncbi:MAG: Rrf2 family transcriptional regulator [Cyanobium sp.]